MDTPIEPPPGGTLFRDPLGVHDIRARPAMRPVVPVRRAEPPAEDPAAKNPFTQLQAANKEHEELNQRLEELVEKLTGEAPRFGAAPENAPMPTGLLPLSRTVARVISERSRHGVTLVEKLEEYLR